MYSYPATNTDPQSREWLSAAYNAGAVIICDLVYAELVPAFTSRVSLDGAPERDRGCAILNQLFNSHMRRGLRWKLYRESGGPRNRIIIDFLIGAHAAVYRGCVSNAG